MLVKLVRVCLVLTYFFVAALVVVAVSLLRPFNPDNTRLGGRIFGWGGIRLLGVEYSVEGQEYLEQMEPSVIVANHQDNLDLFVFGSMIPSRTVSIGKKSLKYLPLFGQAYWLAGNILIDRSNNKQSVGVMSQVSNALHQGRKSIWVFPEGTRSQGQGLADFKKGAFHMALSSGAPVLPICASTYSGKLNLGSFKSGKIIVKVLPPVSVEGLAAEDVDNLMASVYKQMKETIDELDHRIENTCLS